MTRNFTRCLWLVLACVTVVSMVATDADAARRSAMAGNQLIQDFDDTFAFPHLAMKYNHTIMFDFVPTDVYNDFTGNGSLIFGSDDYAINVNTGRLHFGDSLPHWGWGGTDETLYGFGGGVLPALLPAWAPDTAEWFDIGYSWGASSPMGVSLGLIANSSKTEPDSDPSSEESLTLFDIQYSLDLGGTDLGVSVAFGSASDKDIFYPGTTDAVDSSILQFGVSARGDRPAGPHHNWGWLLNFAYGSVGDAVVKGSTDLNKESSTAVAFNASWGPTFGDPSGKWTAAGYLTVDYQSYKNLATGTLGVVNDYSTFTLPGWNLAGEYYPFSWFAVRGGVRSGYVMETDKVVDPNADPTEFKDTTKEFMMYWTAGIGFRGGDSFGIDMTLNPDMLHSGYLLNPTDNNFGSSDNVFGILSMWINWGGS